MTEFFRAHKYIVSLGACVIIILLFVFREDISRFLVVKERPGESVIFPGGQGKSENMSSPDVIPPYTGRDPAEFRPDPKETASFSKEDLDSISSQIQTNARGVREHSDFLEGWLQIGLLKKVIGDFEGARDAWEYAGVIRPLNSVSFANLGELYWRYLPDYRKAEKNFRVSVTNKPDDPAVYISFSDLYYYSYTEKKHLADNILIEGIQKNPGNVDLMKWLAALYERDKNYSLALEWWKKVLEKSPSDAAVRETIADLETKLGK